MKTRSKALVGRPGHLPGTGPLTQAPVHRHYERNLSHRRCPHGGCPGKTANAWYTPSTRHLSIRVRLPGDVRRRSCDAYSSAALLPEFGRSSTGQRLRGCVAERQWSAHERHVVSRTVRLLERGICSPLRPPAQEIPTRRRHKIRWLLSMSRSKRVRSCSPSIPSRMRRSVALAPRCPQ